MTGSLSGSEPETHWFVLAIEDIQYELFTEDVSEVWTASSYYQHSLTVASTFYSVSVASISGPSRTRLFRGCGWWTAVQPTRLSLLSMSQSGLKWTQLLNVSCWLWTRGLPILTLKNNATVMLSKPGSLRVSQGLKFTLLCSMRNQPFSSEKWILKNIYGFSKEKTALKNHS